MRFDELVTELEIEERQWRLSRITPLAVSLRSVRGERREGIRSAVARRIVGLGTWLDGEAVERVAMVRRTG